MGVRNRIDRHPKHIEWLFSFKAAARLPPWHRGGAVRVPSRSISPPNPISSGSPHVRPMWALSTCGEPDKIKKNTHPKYITLFFEQVLWHRAGRCGPEPDRVRVPSRSIAPPWRSIRFRLALRTYAPWGVRVVSQAKSRKIPTRNILPLFLLSRDDIYAGFDSSIHNMSIAAVRPQGRSIPPCRPSHGRDHGS